MFKSLLLGTIVAVCTLNAQYFPGATGGSGTPTFTQTNDAVTGTATNKLVKVSASTAILPATTDTMGVMGVCTSGCGTSGSATVQYAGQVSCVFDGPTIANHFVILSPTVAGDCSDSGATVDLDAIYPYGAQVVGYIRSTNAAAGTYTMLLYPSEMQGYHTSVTALCPSDGADATGCLQNYLTNYYNVYLPPARICYSVTGSLILKSGQALWGTQTFLGSSNGQICQHSTTADTLVAAATLSGARKVFIHDIQLVDAVLSTRTAGAAMHFDGDGAASANNNAEIEVERVYAVGFYDGLWAAATVNSSIKGTRMSLSKRYGYVLTGTQENTSTVFEHNYSDGAGSGGYRIHSASYSKLDTNACDQVTSGDGYHFEPGQTSGLSVTAATWTSNVVTFTLNTAPHAELAAGEQFAVTGVTPTAYNYNDYIALTVSSTTVTAVLASNPGTYTSGGTFVWGNNIRGVAFVGNGDEFPSGHGVYVDGEEFEISGGALSAATGFSVIYINGGNNIKISNSVRLFGGDYSINVNTTPTHNLPIWYYSIRVEHPYCASYVTAMFRDPNRIIQIAPNTRVGVDLATTADLGSATYSNTANGAGGYGATLTNAGTQAALQIDGVTVTLYMHVLVKNQTTTFQNGPYLVTTVGTGSTNWVLTRDPLASTAPDFYNSGPIPVRNLGTTNANTLWHMNAVLTTIGTDAITYTQDH